MNNKLEKICVYGIMAIVIYQATPLCDPCFRARRTEDLPVKESPVFAFEGRSNFVVSSSDSTVVTSFM